MLTVPRMLQDSKVR